MEHMRGGNCGFGDLKFGKSATPMHEEISDAFGDLNRAGCVITTSVSDQITITANYKTQYNK
jgi:hypothetical protein